MANDIAFSLSRRVSWLQRGRNTTHNQITPPLPRQRDYVICVTILRTTPLVRETPQGHKALHSYKHLPPSLYKGHHTSLATNWVGTEDKLSNRLHISPTRDLATLSRQEDTISTAPKYPHHILPNSILVFTHCVWRPVAQDAITTQ